MKPFLISSDFDLVRLKTSNDEYVFSSDNLAIYVRDTSPTIPSDTGIGVLSEASSCTVKYGPDGYDELELEYSATGHLYSKLKLRDIIVAKVGKRGNQPYRIYRITKPIDFKIKIYARHLAYDLMGIVVKPFSAANIKGALSGLKTNAMTNCPFNFSTERTTAVPFEVKRPTSIWSLMSSGEDGLLDVYGGEYLFNGYTVKFEKELGETTGVSVTYGINMTDFEQDSNCENCHTGVVGYWEENDEVIYSPVIGVSGNYDYVNIMTVDLTQYWTEKPSQSDLRSAINTYIQSNKIGVPKVSWTINFVPLGMTEEYKNVAALEHVSIGDTVNVIFEKLGVKATARVTEIVWDVLLDRYKSVSLGDVKNSVARTISGQTTTINNLPTKEKTKSLIKQISTALSESILGANGGSVRFIDTNNDKMPDTLYIADDPDPNQATKVWRFNYEGWAASENGYNGPFKMGATLKDGFLADFITAANLKAGSIISQNGNFSIDLSSGILSTRSSITYKASNYSQSDIDRITDIILGRITPTDADYEKYDFYHDGKIRTVDRTICLRLVDGNDVTISWRAEINPAGLGSVYSVYMTNASGVENLVFSAGVNNVHASNATFGGVDCNGIDASSIDANSIDVSGTIRCNKLYVNGHEIT